MEVFGDVNEKKELVPEEKLTTNDQLMEIVLNTREQCQMVEQLIKSQIEIKDEMIDKLHRELDYYKQQEAERFIDQVMKSLIKVRKDMGRHITSKNFLSMTVEELKREYIYVFEDITDLLEQQNIDAYHSHAGDHFDPAIHQPKLEQCDEPSLDKTIKETINEGYKKGDKVLIPERVIVYQYKDKSNCSKSRIAIEK